MRLPVSGKGIVYLKPEVVADTCKGCYFWPIWADIFLSSALALRRSHLKAVQAGIIGGGPVRLNP